MNLHYTKSMNPDERASSTVRSSDSQLSLTRELFYNDDVEEKTTMVNCLH